MIKLDIKKKIELFFAFSLCTFSFPAQSHLTFNDKVECLTQWSIKFLVHIAQHIYVLFVNYSPDVLNPLQRLL